MPKFADRCFVKQQLHSGDMALPEQDTFQQLSCTGWVKGSGSYSEGLKSHLATSTGKQKESATYKYRFY